MENLSGKVPRVTGAGGIRCTALMPGEVATPIMQLRPKPPSPEDLTKMLQADDLDAMVRYIGEAPAHVYISAALIRPTGNRSFTGVAELGGIRL
jgi:NADP-dependent 3-hydroxy acid dehydrogenase YdfG